MHYEQKALYWGVAINVFSAVLGLVFFVLTKSQTMFLDAFISLILCISTIISLIVARIVSKKDSDKFPLGRYAIENLFLIFRAILMLAIIVYTLVDGVITIAQFCNGTLVNDLNIDFTLMIVYGVLMTLSCFAITFSYSYYNKKLETPSEIIKIEIVSSIFDGLVTIFAVSSLLIFTYLPALSAIAPIGDSIVVIILSIGYLVLPIKEIVKQVRILVDKRENQDIEKEIRDFLNDEYSNFKIYDVYCALSGDVSSIYICLYPKENLLADEISDEFSSIREELGNEYTNSKVILLLSDDKLHSM